MIKRHYTTVELTARVEGDEVVLLDRDGKKIKRLSRHIAVVMSRDAFAAITWKASFTGMINSIKANERRMGRSAWQTKCDGWLVSLRHRRNRKRWDSKHVTQKKASCRYSSLSRPDWGAAVKCLYVQYHNRLHEHRLRQKNPWRLWAQTVIGNHRKKGKRRAESIVRNSEAIGKQIETAGIQMRINGL